MRTLFIYRNEFVEPLGIMSLSAFVKRGGHESRFIDVQFEKDVAR